MQFRFGFALQCSCGYNFFFLKKNKLIKGRKCRVVTFQSRPSGRAHSRVRACKAVGKRRHSRFQPSGPQPFSPSHQSPNNEKHAQSRSPAHVWGALSGVRRARARSSGPEPPRAPRAGGDARLPERPRCGFQSHGLPATRSPPQSALTSPRSPGPQLFPHSPIPRP